MQISLRSRYILVLLIISLLVMICSRGVLAAEQYLHSNSPNLDLDTFVQFHDHSHSPVLDHFHGGPTTITDQDHLLLHLLESMENQSSLSLNPPLPSLVPGQVAVSPTLSPLTPLPYTLYRPPKFSRIS
ncbi:hypothetical protein [Hahella ganghwensis]|uniref:hypothetical protein n=1 Tax=Hahella ganghwensis TaxID=286420 RepID=UPI0012FB070C|nr:hypothetical protein [Hahella ganghwensis]